jgi:hypothetical protein
MCTIGPLIGAVPPIAEKEAGDVTAKVIHRLGVRSSYIQTAAMGSVALCLTLWLRAAGLDQDERGNAERRAIFVGLWGPTLWTISQSVAELE